jgi:hypothetical protein
MMLTKQRRDEIRARCEAATTGPWEYLYMQKGVSQLKKSANQWIGLLADWLEANVGKACRLIPAAAIARARELGLMERTSFSVQTLYSYIDKGIFMTLSNKTLPRGKQKQKYRHVHTTRKPQQRKNLPKTSIEKRPDEIFSRAEMGHWEMDCVESRKGVRRTLLVLTERKTRYEIVTPI